MREVYGDEEKLKKMRQQQELKQQLENQMIEKKKKQEEEKRRFKEQEKQEQERIRREIEEEKMKDELEKKEAEMKRIKTLEIFEQQKKEKELAQQQQSGQKSNNFGKRKQQSEQKFMENSVNLSKNYSNFESQIPYENSITKNGQQPQQQLYTAGGQNIARISSSNMDFIQQQQQAPGGFDPIQQKQDLRASFHQQQQALQHNIQIQEYENNLNDKQSKSGITGNFMIDNEKKDNVGSPPTIPIHQDYDMNFQQQIPGDVPNNMVVIKNNNGQDIMVDKEILEGL